MFSLPLKCNDITFFVGGCSNSLSSLENFFFRFFCMPSFSNACLRLMGPGFLPVVDVGVLLVSAIFSCSYELSSDSSELDMTFWHSWRCLSTKPSPLTTRGWRYEHSQIHQLAMINYCSSRFDSEQKQKESPVKVTEIIYNNARY